MHSFHNTQTGHLHTQSPTVSHLTHAQSTLSMYKKFLKSPTQGYQ